MVTLTYAPHENNKTCTDAIVKDLQSELKEQNARLQRAENEVMRLKSSTKQERCSLRVSYFLKFQRMKLSNVTRFQFKREPTLEKGT